MCTPPRRHLVSPQRLHSRRSAGISNPVPNPAGAHCRWIDHSGMEWLFTRAGDSLVVERPNARGSVAIRFPDLLGISGSRAAKQAWVVLESEDGSVFHCGVSSAETPMGEPTPPDPASRWSRANRSVRTWFESAGPVD